MIADGDYTIKISRWCEGICTIWLNTKTPCEAGRVVIAVKVKASPSVSESLVATVPLTGVSSFVVLTSLTATGASLIGLIVIVKVAVSHKVASQT